MPFVSFEGVDGSGKTTQVDRLVRELRRRSMTVVQTKEPDGGHIGAAIRTILVDKTRAEKLSLTEELLLVSAARYDHVHGVIKPALARGEWVITDRFYDSTFAFQVFETEVDPDLFSVVTQSVTGGLKPDLTLVLDLPEEISRSRRTARQETSANHDPSEAFRDFGRIQQALRHLVSLEPDRCRRVDASDSADAVAAKVLQLVDGARLSQTPG